LNRPDLLARCIASIDYPVDRLVIVQNGRDEDMPDLGNLEPRTSNIQHRIIIKHPNAGVAGSWNEVIKLFAAPFWMLVNNDIEFAPGDLEKMMSYTNAEIGNAEMLKSERPGILYGNHRASWFVITADCVSRAGLIDENFFPAYLEDCDYSRRCDLLRVRRINVPDCHAIHGTATDGADQTKGSCTIHSDERLARANMRTHGRNFEYYRAKWGGINGEEKFKTPFNDPHWPIQHWNFLPEMRELQQGDWDKANQKL
jgi:GT2 family glycosyltransferase